VGCGVSVLMTFRDGVLNVQSRVRDDDFDGTHATVVALNCKRPLTKVVRMRVMHLFELGLKPQHIRLRTWRGQVEGVMSGHMMQLSPPLPTLCPIPTAKQLSNMKCSDATAHGICTTIALGDWKRANQMPTNLSDFVDGKAYAYVGPWVSGSGVTVAAEKGAQRVVLVHRAGILNMQYFSRQACKEQRERDRVAMKRERSEEREERRLAKLHARTAAAQSGAGRDVGGMGEPTATMHLRANVPSATITRVLAADAAGADSSADPSRMAESSAAPLPVPVVRAVNP